MLKESVKGVATSKCGQTVSFRKGDVTIWAKAVTCPACLAGVTILDEQTEYSQSIAAIAPLTTKPGAS